MKIDDSIAGELTTNFELAEWDHQVTVYGNVAFRTLRFIGRQRLPGHQHNFAHATEVVFGSIGLALLYPDGRREYFTGDSGDVFEVPAECKHVIWSRSENGAVCRCVFAVRDEDGGVVYQPTEKQKADRFWNERLGGGISP